MAEKSNITIGQRIFAASGALLFLFSSIALSVFVIISVVQDSKKKDTAATAAVQTCEDNKTEDTLAAPEVFKPEGTVDSLQSTDLETGSGPDAKAGDCLVMKYYGTLATTGNMFDENYTKPNGFAFELGQGKVIEGWDKGLVGMKAGGTRRLVIPAAQAYGSQSPSEQIPANSDLVFTVKLLRIQKIGG